VSDPVRDVGYGSASAFGTFGELLQGALPDGRDFLVTLPIARWSTARFFSDPTASKVQVWPAHKEKSRRLARQMLAGRGGGVLLLESDLPEGKGLASSSADLVATARAVAAASGAEIPPHDVEALLRFIEPSDGVMYPGVVAFCHREVRLLQRLGHLPPMAVVGIDEGGEIETVAFNKQPKEFTPEHTRAYAELLAELSRAIAVGDASGIGVVATRSALMNQRLCRKRTLDDMIAICDAVGGLGVVTTQSGTALGILLAADAPGYQIRLERTRAACSALAETVWVEHCLPGSAPAETGYLPVEQTVGVPAPHVPAYARMELS
jgi:L-threonine kinase